LLCAERSPIKNTAPSEDRKPEFIPTSLVAREFEHDHNEVKRLRLLKVLVTDVPLKKCDVRFRRCLFAVVVENFLVDVS
jgi:hypothetical protein